MTDIVISAGIIATGSSYVTDADSVIVYGTTSHFSVASGAVISVGSGGITSNTQIDQNGSEIVYSGGSATSTLVNSGGGANCL